MMMRIAVRQALQEGGAKCAMTVGLTAPAATSTVAKRAMSAEPAAAAAAAPPPPPPSSNLGMWAAGAAVLGGGFMAYSMYGGGPSPLAPGPVITKPVAAKEPASKPGDYAAVRKSVADALDAEYDDGSYGPVLVRLAWHSSGTYDAKTKTGGSNGATMRFSPESNHGANAGLATARALLDPIKAKHPWITYADLWTLAGAVAIEEMGGPHIPWRAGRADRTELDCAPDGRLPDASQGAAHIRAVFTRMGFNDQELVALSGAHSLGRCHTDRSGFSGPWTNSPTTFSNLYFTELLNDKWTKKKWDGPMQYEDKTGTLMMLPTDLALITDKKLKKYTDMYAKDGDKFAADFAKAFSTLLELGVPFAADAAPAV